MRDSSCDGEFTPFADLTVCVSTMNGGLVKNHALTNQLLALGIPVVVVNQITRQDPRNQELKARLSLPHINIYETTTCGLSRSRNDALRLATTSWALLCDDDVWFSQNGIHQLAHELPKYDNSEVGAVTTQLLRDNDLDWRNYSVLPETVNGTSIWAKLQIQHINSMELVLHAKNMKKHGVSFRQHWGLGTTPAPGGEEVLLLNDLLENELTLQRINVGVRIHPDESSGSGINTTNAFVQGSTNSVIFPRLVYWGLGVWLTFKHLIRRRSDLKWGVAYFKGGHWASCLTNHANE